MVNWRKIEKKYLKKKRGGEILRARRRVRRIQKRGGDRLLCLSLATGLSYTHIKLEHIECHSATGYSSKCMLNDIKICNVNNTFQFPNGGPTNQCIRHREVYF